MFPAIDKRKTGIYLRRIMDERGLSVKDVQQYLGIGSVQSVYHWLNGLSMPTIDNLYALRELFQMPVDGMCYAETDDFFQRTEMMRCNTSVWVHIMKGLMNTKQHKFEDSFILQFQ